ncbi:hypothetical protein ABZ490_44055 [Streptomyces sp. NPDC005811]|uniref:hypothetical protein n=1 Tax=Streptomyces sp. NPDC005811 TaxID=3154565 RepID=UPI003402F140
MKLRTKRVVLAAVGTLATVVVPLAGATSSWASDASPTTAQHGLSQAQWKGINAVATSQHALGVFGNGTSTPVVTLPAGTSASEKAKATADVPDGVKAAVKISRFTKKQVDQLQDSVLNVKQNKDVAKYDFGAFYDGQADQVMINTDAPKSVVDSLEKTYGNKVTVLKTRFEQQETRYNDTSPYWGGTSVGDINADEYGSCTSGYKIHVGNTYYMTSAGHCFGLNVDIFQTSFAGYNIMQDNGVNRKIGTIGRTGTHLDVAAYTGRTYGSGIFTGTYSDASTGRTVIGLGPMYRGLHVCVSGRTTLAHCNHPITSTSYGFTWYLHGVPHTTAPVDGFTYDAGQTPPTQAGDSGAPVYQPISASQALAVGSHSGLTTWLQPATNHGCGCYLHRMYGVKFGSVLSQWGAGLN